MNETTELTIKDIDTVLNESITSWLNEAQELDPLFKDELLKRLDKYKLKVSTIVLELQRKYLNEMMNDIEWEVEARRTLRRNFFFMEPSEQNQMFKMLSTISEERLTRLERQMAGFDLPANVEFSIQTLAETKLPTEVVDKVKDLSPARRRNLSNVMSQMIKSIEEKDAEEKNSNS
jgi:hypothetical protein